MKTIKIFCAILFLYMILGFNDNLYAFDKKINGTKTFKVEKNGLLDLKLNPGDIYPSEIYTHFLYFLNIYRVCFF